MSKLTLKKIRRVRWFQVLFCVVFAAAWGTIPGIYHRWKAKRDYDRHYSNLLELPLDISPRRAFMQRLPGVEGKALWIDLYEPDAGEFDKLRTWLINHDGFSEVTSHSRSLPNNPRDWEGKKGQQSLMIDQGPDGGWIHITLCRRMSAEDAKKDLVNYPWKLEMQEIQSHSYD